MKFHHYLSNLKRIYSVWSEFLIYSKRYSQLHFLVCHKIFWAYFRQGLFRKEFKISFPAMPNRNATIYLSYLHSVSSSVKIFFNNTQYVDEVLDKCGFSLLENDFSSNKTFYYFREER